MDPSYHQFIDLVVGTLVSSLVAYKLGKRAGIKEMKAAMLAEIENLFPVKGK